MKTIGALKWSSDYDKGTQTTQGTSKKEGEYVFIRPPTRRAGRRGGAVDEEDD